MSRKERRGITVAGNIVADAVINIDRYPQIGMLSNISSVSRSVGGCVPNTGIDLAKIDGSLPVSAIGCIGNDEYGRFIVSQLKRFGIDTSRIVVSDKTNTSFSDVMNLPTGERTFFHLRGANAEFDPSQISLPGLSCRILHIGYILLLNRFDAEDPEYGTVMARFLHDVQAQGVLTSVDMVSDSAADYAKTAKPALKYCDYFIVNEIECCAIWGLSPRKNGQILDLAAVREAMRRTMDCGVKEKVVVHAKEAGFCLSRDGSFTAAPSLDIPEAMMKGSVGAGDAFCAGALYGIYHQMKDQEMLEFASAAAACSLFAENAVDGMKNRQEIVEMMRRFPRKAFADSDSIRQEKGE